LIAPGQYVTVTGPNGRRHTARVLTTYQSTGGVTSVWIDLCEHFLANPANSETADWCTRVLVLTEREGKYLDLWEEQWCVESGGELSLNEESGPNTRVRE
jgi:hypothetical protein